MNAEFDRDLTSQEQEQLSGGLFFRDDLPAEFVDQFQYASADIPAWPHEPKSAGLRRMDIR